jgi:hypothetical protein
VVGLDNATLEIESEKVIVNGLSGRVIVNPDGAPELRGPERVRDL